jgi:cephalosporin-C deacetylase-like acetyl esterase
MKSMNNLISRRVCLALLLLVGGAQAKPLKPTAYALRVTTDRMEALYHRGEQVKFTILLTHSNQPLDGARVKWKISRDGKEPALQEGATLTQAGRVILTGKLDEPGFLQCRADISLPGESVPTGRAGAAIDPLEIKPSMPVPDDFAAFWAEQKKQLAVVPVNARLTPVISPVAEVECFDVQADSAVGKLSAYLTRPKGAAAKSLPAIVLTHGAGVASSRLSTAVKWAQDGLLALDFGAHGLPNGKPKDFYAQLYRGELKDYFWKGRDSRSDCFFRELYLRLQRALDVVTVQPEWDGKRLVVCGRSQGGGQALVAGGLDTRVTFVAAEIPAFCDHTGITQGRINGWPRLIPNDIEKPDPKAVQAVRYFDAVNFAARARAQAFITVGFIDVVCPPTGVYAAFNQLPQPKKIWQHVDTGHISRADYDAGVRTAILAYLQPATP